MAFLLTLSGAGFPLLAQTIAYTSLNNFRLWYNGQEFNTLRLDLNRDGLDDFELWVSTYELDILPQGSNSTYAISVQPPDLGSYAVPSSLGTLIGPTLPPPAQWIPFTPNEELPELGYGSIVVTFFGDPVPRSRGLFAGKDAYLGLKFLISGEPHYGWLHLICTNLTDAVISGYAYETRPNTAIRAGAKPVEVPLAPPEIVRSGQLRLAWPSALGKAYQIQCKETLRAPFWTNLNFSVIGSATNTIVDLPISGLSQFFRVVEAD